MAPRFYTRAEFCDRIPDSAALARSCERTSSRSRVIQCKSTRPRSARRVSPSCECQYVLQSLLCLVSMCTLAVQLKRRISKTAACLPVLRIRRSVLRCSSVANVMDRAAFLRRLRRLEAQTRQHTQQGKRFSNGRRVSECATEAPAQQPSQASPNVTQAKKRSRFGRALDEMKKKPCVACSRSFREAFWLDLTKWLAELSLRRGRGTHVTAFLLLHEATAVLPLCERALGQISTGLPSCCDNSHSGSDSYASCLKSLSIVRSPYTQRS